MIDALSTHYPFPKALLTGVLLVNLLIATLVWISLQSSRSHFDRQAEVTTRNISQILDENITGIFSRVDISLQAVADEVEHQLTSGTIREEGLNNFIIRQHSRLPELLSFRATNAAGDAIYGPKTKVANTISLAHRDYFRLLRDTQNAGMVISKPVVGGISGKKMIVLARRINRPDGGFAGLVYAGLSMDYLTKSFSAPDIGANGAITLLDGDLSIVARYPESRSVETKAGVKTVSQELRDLITSGKSTATYRSKYISDGIERLSSYRRISHQQTFYIVTGMSISDYLTHWRSEVLKLCLFWIAACIFTAVSAWFLYKTRGAEMAVLKSDQRFRQFIENANDLIYSLSPTGIITYIAPNVKSLLGYHHSELIGTQFQPLIHQDELPACLHFLQETIKNGIIQSGLEFRIRHKNGNWLWFVSNAAIITDVSTNEPVFLGIGHAITDRKQAEAALQVLNDELEQRVLERTKAAEDAIKELNKLSKVVEQSPNPIMITDENGSIEYVNPAFTTVTGYSAEEACGRSAGYLGSGNTSETVVSDMWQTIKRGMTWKGEFNNRRKDGREYIEAAIISPLLDAENHITHYLAIKDDITERRSMELQLQQSQKLDAIGQLTGGIAHDFNNKLMIILGYASLAQMDINNSAKVLGYLDGITNAANQSRQMTIQLLGFSRQQVTMPVVLDVNSCIEETTKMLPRLIGENISFIFSKGENLWNIRIDPVQLDQITMNMAVNARDAMPDGGTFTIETRNATCDADSCKNKINIIPGDYVCISFNDTGTGIDPEILEHIFEPFFTTKELGKGTGLGLATIHGIVNQNGGFIEVASSQGEGSLFTVCFPRHHAVTGSSTGENESLIQGSGSILLVEDEEQLREMAAIFLRKIGYTVFAFGSPDKALETASDKSLKLDLVLTDVVMPEMNGMELVERIRETRPEIKAFFVSGYLANHAALEAVVSDGYFLQKPYNLHKLSQMLDKALS